MSKSIQSTLLEVIEDGSFWTLPDADLLHLVQKEFKGELEHLKHAYSVRPGDWREMPGSPSKILYPDEEVYDEVNRSLVGFLSLRWINDDDYEQFTQGQPEDVRLQRESFQWIRRVFEQQGILNSRDYKLFVLSTSIVSNDLGKSTSFVDSYVDATGEDIRHENHDMILHKAVKRGMVPSLESLKSQYRDEVKRGIKLGSEFNVGQLAQAEDAPASLVPLLDMVNHEGAWNLRWMEQLLDIAGGAGHERHDCAAKLIEPIFRSYRSVYDIVSGIVEGKLTLRQGYDQNLVTRYELITSCGWRPPKSLSVDRQEDRALMRIFCMANVASVECAELYYATFYSNLIGNSVRQQLVRHLNRDGTVDKPAVQPTYEPGMMTGALANFDKAPRDRRGDNTRERTVAAMLKYLARVLTNPPDADILAEGDVTVIERDCRVTIKDAINSDEFLSNPDMLETAPLPIDAVANRAKGAQRPRI